MRKKVPLKDTVALTSGKDSGEDTPERGVDPLQPVMTAAGSQVNRNLHRGALAGWKIGKMVIAKPVSYKRACNLF
jgi:hypothetical protein